MKAFKVVLSVHKEQVFWWSQTVFVDGGIETAIQKAKELWSTEHNKTYKMQLAFHDILVEKIELVAEGV